MNTPRSKASVLREHLAAGRLEEALRLAASFPRLGAQRNVILDARTAFTNPRWLVQLGHCPDAAKAAGHAALIERFCKAEADA